MAEAKSIKVSRVVEIPGVQLDMDVDEAMMLRDVLYKVGGFEASRRIHADRILQVLDKLVPVKTWSDKPDLVVSNDGLWFKSPSEMEGS
jgi:hypothetical protein